MLTGAHPPPVTPCRGTLIPLSMRWCVFNCVFFRTYGALIIAAPIGRDEHQSAVKHQERLDLQAPLDAGKAADGCFQAALRNKKLN